MEQEAKNIVFKGNSEGLIIVIPEDYIISRVLEEIEAKVSAAARFFKGAKIKVSYRGLKLSDNEELQVKEILDAKSGAVIEGFAREEESARTLAQRGTQAAQAASQGVSAASQAQPRRSFFSGIDEGSCKFVRSTVRNGMRIDFDGNVVVVGDVNPGGEIIAAGNVVVLGTLRGMVHAGADGNRDAFIYALNLRPTQIRIAGAIARMPEDDAEASKYPEIAEIKEDGIVVDKA